MSRMSRGKAIFHKRSFDQSPSVYWAKAKANVLFLNCGINICLVEHSVVINLYAHVGWEYIITGSYAESQK